MNLTPAGEGVHCNSWFRDALTAIERKTAIALREPSLGPTSGLKGGATGGGYASQNLYGRNQFVFHRETCTP